VWGAIRDSWVGSGAENGQYGYPTGDEYNYGNQWQGPGFPAGPDHLDAVITVGVRRVPALVVPQRVSTTHANPRTISGFRDLRPDDP